jgi:hypothetical protein
MLKLKPYCLIRIHRSVVVNISAVEEIQPLPTGLARVWRSGGKRTARVDAETLTGAKVHARGVLPLTQRNIIVQKAFCMLAPASKTVRRPRPILERESVDDINNFDSPEEIRKMRKRHVEIGRQMQAVGAKAFQELQRKVAAGEITLSVADAKALFDLGAKIKAAALGDAPIPPESSKKPN